jgi:putative tryptophan/tyrosine transport system substrate-binding protein
MFIAAGLVASLGVRAQPQTRVVRIGVLTTIAPVPVLREALLQGLRELGYVEGRNILLIWRDAEGNVARLPAAARELVALEVDVLVVASSSAVRAAKDATKTIPIVMAATTDAVANGLIASLAHPGGNVTGLTLITPELTAKRLELLKAMVSPLTHVGLLVDQSSVAGPNMVRQAEEVGRALGVSVSVVWVTTRDDLEGAVAKLAGERVQGLLIELSPLTFANRDRLAQLVNARRLPAMAEVIEFAAAGLLCGYGPQLSESYRHAAVYVDKIIKGAKPADLPVEQPTKFELVINLKTAKSIGVTIPQSLLLRADDVIQ